MPCCTTSSRDGKRWKRNAAATPEHARALLLHAARYLTYSLRSTDHTPHNDKSALMRPRKQERSGAPLVRASCDRAVIGTLIALSARWRLNACTKLLSGARY